MNYRSVGGTPPVGHTRSHMLAELAWRMEALPQELARWKGSTEANVLGLGIHTSQIAAINKMMDAVISKHPDLFALLRTSLQSDDFARHYCNLRDQIVGAHDLWRLFRSIMLQRLDNAIRPALNAASLIAADCYNTCANQKCVIDGQFRAPPLIWLAAGSAPSTVNRGRAVNTLGLPFTHHPRQPLPFPVIMLPLDQLDCMWLYPTIYHEVGHNLDQDLGLTSEMAGHLEQRLLRVGVRPHYLTAWQTWIREILADTIGILLGGAGFAHTMVSLLHFAPKPELIAESQEHPHTWLRIGLLAALLRQSGVEELAKESEVIEVLWQQIPSPPDAGKYAGQIDLVAGVLLTQKLNRLKGYCLPALVPDLASAVTNMGKLAAYFHSGKKRPSMDSFPYRLVPAAAQLAFASLARPTLADLATIQQRVMESLNAIKPPKKLSPNQRLQRTLELARQLTFYDD
jgi:hypothetical protein